MKSDANALPSPALGGDAALLLLLKARTFIALIAVFVFLALAAPNFLSAANMVILAKHVALNAILAIGMTFVIITGGIDLSVGSIVGLCGMVAGYLVLYGIDLAFLGVGYTRASRRLARAACSHGPAWMDANLPTAFETLAGLGAPITHYKMCSTLDSSPEVGSVGRAIDLALRVFPQRVDTDPGRRAADAPLPGLRQPLRVRPGRRERGSTGIR